MSRSSQPYEEDVAQVEAVNALQEMTNGYWVTQIVCDLHMLGVSGGRERREDEYRTLLAEADLQLTRIIPTDVPRCIIEALPQ
jgi:hypothetical protein